VEPDAEMSRESTGLSGTAADVPYVALPPAEGHDGDEAAPLILAWHLNDPPRSAAAMASALPLAGVAAWRVYLDLPMHGRRQLPGLDEFMQLGYEDAVLRAFEPQVTQAVAEFPAVLTELQARLPLTDGPIGLVGASIGTLPAQLVIAEGAAQVTAAVLISPVIQLAEVIAANERRFNVSYPWSDASRAVASPLDFVARADEIAALRPQPALLLITGAEDDPAFPLQAQRLHLKLRRRYNDSERLRQTSIPGMKHGFAAEPGIEPAPQTAEAQLVDTATTNWFRRHLT
jgi:dienelactone hydrolase